jgi:FimV-like protein
MTGLVLISPQLFALGLGEATVYSYLNQPLDSRIKLISRSEAELASVTAGLASADDFRIIGLNRATLSVPLQFEVVQDIDDPHIRMTSSLPINEPVVQVVVEVVWSSGRMLRQYTLFLDPPTFRSAAPLPAPSRSAPREETPPPVEINSIELARAEPPPAEPEPASPPVAVAEPEQEPEREVTGEPLVQSGPPPDTPDPGDLVGTGPDFAPPEEADPEPEPAEPEPEAIMAEPKAAEPEPEVIEPEPEAAEPEPEVIEPEPEAAESEPEVIEPEPEAAEPEPEVTEPEPEAIEPEPVYRAVIPDPADASAVSITVQRGDTLWGIARDWSKDTEYSINQTMLAIQQQNPEAFNKGNINSLKSGAVLRMPGDAGLGRVSGREAMLEVMRQEDVYRNRWDETPDSESIPALADLAPEPGPEPEIGPEPVTPPVTEPEPELAIQEDARLELVPPSVSEGGAGSGLGQGAGGDSGESSGESVVEELARTQEELTNAQQQNEYLNERIRELQNELDRRAEVGEGVVQDAGLAEMEARLEAERTDPDQADEELAVIPPSETEPWYVRLGGWVLGVALLLVAAIVWWLRSRPSLDSDDDQSGDPPDDSGGDSENAPPADETTRVIESVPAPGPDQGQAEGESDDSTNVIDMDQFKPPELNKGAMLPHPDEEAVELDTDDPETLLDLARAYQGMGDIDSAVAMLEKVLTIGDEAQLAEARAMMDEF